MQHLGATFYKYLNKISISVCENKIRPVDPTFADPKGVAYDVAGIKAEQLPPQEFTITDEITGQNRV